MQFADGRWGLRDAGGAGGAARAPACSTAGGLTTATLEAQVRTLHVEAYTLLTTDERKDLATRNKAAAGKKRPAFPGDTDTGGPDHSLNPFAEWPWDQSLNLRDADSYNLSGRILRNALRWSNRHHTDQLTQIAHKARQDEQEKLYTEFRDAISDNRLDRALLTASLALSEAREEMNTVAANAALAAANHPSSELLQYISKQRTDQVSRLHVFLGDLSQRVTDATKTTGSEATQRATAAYVDFLEGWLGKGDVTQIRAESLKLTSAAAASVTVAHSQVSGAAQAAAGGGGPSSKAARTSGGSTPSTGGGGGSGVSSGGAGGSGATPPATRSKGLGAICVFQQNIPCSASVVGDTLGVKTAPPCKLCGHGNHFHGECPQSWGRISKPLPGFNVDGSRCTGEWTKKNEPIQKVVKAWVKFISDASNFTVSAPSPAGVAGAPSLADFQRHAPLAPPKP
jgi:hypothetical protein